MDKHIQAAAEALVEFDGCWWSEGGKSPFADRHCAKLAEVAVRAWVASVGMTPRRLKEVAGLLEVESWNVETAWAMGWAEAVRAVEQAS